MRLEIPNETHQEIYEDMIQEWWSYEEIPTSPSLLFRWSNFDDFLEDIRLAQKGKIKNNIPSTLFFLIDGKEIIWWIDIRHHINHPKLQKGWHIGYWIRPSQRVKWYATKMLQMWLEEAKKIGIQKVLISCHPDNIASEKVILKNWWIHDSTLEYENKIYKRYWIEL